MSELIQYKCPCCGGAVEFNSTAQKMKCPYCDTEFEIETLKKYDEELKQEKQKEDQNAVAGRCRKSVGRKKRPQR